MRQHLTCEILRNLICALVQDLPNPAGAEDIIEKLSLHAIPQRQWHVQLSSATTGDGLFEGMDWLASQA